MQFTMPGTAAVFAQYERRHAAETALIAAMQPGEMGPRRDEFLLPVGREAGAFLHALVLAHRPARILELGTSYGYSALFLADAAASYGGALISIDLSAEKQAHARIMLDQAGLGGGVTFKAGDAVGLVMAEAGQFDFVLLDVWKGMYVPCFEALYPKLAGRGLLLSDNMIHPATTRDSARALRAAIRARPDMQTVLLPVGQGLELSVKWGAGSTEL
jgi:predicted O-methyltransferase YrrM